MEFLIVRFDEPRRVRIDGKLFGATDQVLRLEAGPWTVSLAGPQDYDPPECDIDLTNTSPESPMEVTFE